MLDLKLGDCLDVLKTLDDESIDSIVTDPPYGLAFMAKRWDYDVPSVEVWQECLRVLKPGGYLLAFAGTRTQHRMCVRIEDAGFEIRDMIAWVYGSGFPKSHDVSKAIDSTILCGGSSPKLQADTRESLGRSQAANGETHSFKIGSEGVYRNKPGSGGQWEPATDAARQWQGWGTALKPALEPITVARKPLVGTVADNVMRYGTGAINVDGCRVDAHGEKTGGDGYIGLKASKGWNANNMPYKREQKQSITQGRWPANLIHDGSDEVTGLFPGDEGRFFYCPKASKRDRDEGLSLPESTPGQKTGRAEGSDGISPYAGSRSPTRNNHPTVKPTDLMRYLCRLVTQPGGIVLDPFMGSGSTGKAATLEGLRFVGIERETSYLEIAKARIESVQAEAETKKPDDGQMALF
jgi:site-specific DNA-methyltransferase (adenine-specific)